MTKTAIIYISRRPPCRIALHVKIGRITPLKAKGVKVIYALLSVHIVAPIARVTARTWISGIY